MSHITFTELDGVEVVTTDRFKFVSTSDTPALKFNYKFEVGKRYRIVGKMFHADYCFPQPTLRFFNTKTKKTQFLAFFYNSNKNVFDLVFSLESPDEVVTIVPFFQKGSFEFQNIAILEISDLSFKFFKAKTKIRPYFSFIE